VSFPFYLSTHLLPPPPGLAQPIAFCICFICPTFHIKLDSRAFVHNRDIVSSGFSPGSPAPALVLFSGSVPSFPLVLRPLDWKTPTPQAISPADGNKLPITKVFHSKASAVVVAPDFASVAAFDSVTPSLFRFPFRFPASDLEMNVSMELD